MGVGGADGESGAEAELVAMLAEEKFQGPLWDRFADDLARAGLRVIRPWIGTGRIFAELRRKGVACRRPVPMTDAEVDDLAAETVARAINPFRSKMLMSGRWDPNGAARLSSLFVTQCLHQFPNAYRSWMRDRFASTDVLPGYDEVVREAEERARDDPVHHRHDPEDTVVAREQLDELLDLLPDRIRGPAQLVLQGYSFRQAAQMHGDDPDALQRQLWRLRPRLRRALGQYRGDGR